MREVRYKKSAKNREIVDNQFFFLKKITCLCVSPQFCGIQFQLNQRRERERERRWEGKNGGFAPPRRGGGGRGPPHRGGRLHRRRHQLLRLGPKPRIRPRRLPGSPRSPPFSRVAVLNQGGKERFLLGFMEKTGPKVGFWHGQIRRLIKDFGIVSCEWRSTLEFRRRCSCCSPDSSDCWRIGLVLCWEFKSCVAIRCCKTRGTRCQSSCAGSVEPFVPMLIARFY